MEKDIVSAPATRKRRPAYQSLWVQVLVAIGVAVVLGFVRPAWGVAMKPLGDVFIRLITMVITLVIFCTVTTGIAGMQDLKKVGRVGGKALLYFEVVSTLALLIGLVVGNTVRPGAGFHVDPSTLDAGSVVSYAGAARGHGVVDFLVHLVPTTVVGAFDRGDILQVLFVSVLFGFALTMGGTRCEPVTRLLEALTTAVFRVVDLLMLFAPAGAFGAMAFTIGKYGIASLGPLAELVVTFYITSAIFVIAVLGAVTWACGFNILKFLGYIKEEMVLVLATSSSETALPRLMEKLEALGCSKALVGLVVPTGYTFNTDGTSLYMTMAALFVAQATNTHVTLGQQLTIFAVAILTSKGASGVQGAAFIALVGTLLVVPTIPVAGMALILGIDRFMSMCRALVNMIGNGVATLVVARWERELDMGLLKERMAQRWLE